jgi:hypothetical protein
MLHWVGVERHSIRSKLSDEQLDISKELIILLLIFVCINAYAVLNHHNFHHIGLA